MTHFSNISVFGSHRSRHPSRAGIALVLVVLLLSALVSVASGIFMVIFGELRISGEISDSFVALYAADEAIEKLLYDDLVRDAVPGCGGTASCSYESSELTLPNGSCMTLRLTRTASTPNTTVVGIGEYRCEEPYLAVRRSFQARYTKSSAGGAGFIENGGFVSGEAEDWTSIVAQGSKNWVLASSVSGYSSRGYMESLADSGTNHNTGYTTLSPRLDYAIDFNTTGTYYVWVRMYAADNAEDSAHAGLDTIALASADRIDVLEDSRWRWTRDTLDGTPATIVVSTPGLHTLNLWMREDGSRIDRWILTTDASYVPPELVGYWKFDEGSGTTANDSSAADNDGVLQNGPIWTAGKFGGGLQFDGIDDAVSMGDQSEYDFGTQNFTVAGWLRTTASNRHLIGKRSICGHASFWNILSGPSISGEVDQDSSGTNYNVFGAGVNIADNLWHHFAVTRQGATIRVYIDGSLAVTDTGPGTASLSNGASLFIGDNPCAGVNGSEEYLGILDEIRIYNGALNANEVQQLYSLVP